MKKYLAVLIFFAVNSGAQATPREEAGLDALLSTPISTAAKYEQRMSEVAASVTIVTAEEIARYGWHTLADVLSGVRGVYTTYDRGYTYLGVRGVGLPTDYNNRFLVLIDGVPMLDTVSGAIDIGTALAIDLSTLERVEFVRGPSSVLYGTGAMFGVINLISKKAGETPSLTLGAGNGDLRTGGARAGFDHGGIKGTIAASWQEKNGGDFRDPLINVQEGDIPSDAPPRLAPLADYDDYKSVMGNLAWRSFRVFGLRSTRTKGITSALDDKSYGRDERFIDHRQRGLTNGRDEQFIDGRSLLGVRYDHAVRPGQQVSFTAFYDRFAYRGDYPGSDAVIAFDESVSTRVAAEAQYIWDIRPNHRLTFGARHDDIRRASYRFGSQDEKFDVNVPYTVDSGYAQSEWQPTTGMTITAGASYDHYSNGTGSHFTPRGAIILSPSINSTLKVLYGQGFRAANVFERFPQTEEEMPLKPERIRTTELVWEYRMNSDFLLTSSLFHIDAEDVIRFETSWGQITQYVNSSHLMSSGAEVQVDYRRGDGIWSYINYSAQRTRENGEPMANSPAQLVKAGFSTPTSHALQAAAEVLWSAPRMLIADRQAAGYTTMNLNLTRTFSRHVSVALTVRNLFDTDYVLPGGAGNTQSTIPQEGRSYLIRVITRAR
jgi:iron complex outermembrane receptor protein